MPQNSEAHNNWVENNREKVRGYQRAYVARNLEKVRSASREEKRKRSLDPMLRKIDTDRVKQSARRAKDECILAYGSKCACCSESQKEFLSFDHVNGGGTKYRKSGGKAGMNLALWLRKNGFPKEFRLLCHNCNQSMGYHGFCPHQQERFVGVPTLSDFDLSMVVGL